MYKTVYSTLANNLNDRSLPSKWKSFVGETQTNAHINYKQEVQVAAVQDIVELLAVELLIAVATHFISSFNCTNTCARRNNEDHSDFFSRFRGLPADHVMHAGFAANSQVGEILTPQQYKP